MSLFKKITPAEAGVNPEGILKFLDSIEEQHLHVHSFIFMRHDAIIAEGSYAPYNMIEPHMLYSLSKSFTSVAIGFAVQEGLLKLEDKVKKFFEEKLPSKPCENMEKVTIKDLLTMNTGHNVESFHIFYEREKDWVYEFLTSYIALEPGSQFLYNTPATYMLSAILQKVSGETTFDYLKPRLFKPLEFSNDIWWETSPQEITVGGVGLNISTQDIAKFGTFLLRKGNYGGKQLLNSKWFDEAVTPWSDNSMNENEDWRQGYGYQFWMCTPTNVYRGDGAFGQYCIILPDQDMVIAINGGFQNMQKLLTILWKNILPAVSDSIELTADINKYQQMLEEKLSHLELECYYKEKLSNCQELKLHEFALRKFEVSDNLFNITKIALSNAEGMANKYILSLEIDGKWNSIGLSNKFWTKGFLDLSSQKEVTQTKNWSFYSGLFEKIAVKGCMHENTLYLDMAFINTPFQDTWEIKFESNGLTAHVKRNVGFNEVDINILGRAL